MTDTGSYTIEILAFSGVEASRAATSLAKVFGIAEDKAQRLVDRVPVKVRSGAPREETLRYLKALLSVGAEVRIHGSTGQRIYRPDDGGNPGATFTGAYAAVGSAPEPVPKPLRPLAPLPGETGRIPASQLPRIVCPKCGLEQPGSPTCTRCGIVFAKYSAAQSRVQTARDGAHSAPLPSLTGRMPAVEPSPTSSPSGRFAPVEPPTTAPVAERSPDPYVVSPLDDDGLFRDRRRAFDPTPLIRVESGIVLAAATSGPHPATPVRPLSPTPITTGMAIHKPTGLAAAQVKGSSDVGFWNKIGPAALFNVSEQSYQWLFLMAALGALSWVMSYFAGKIPILTVQLPALFVMYVLFAAFLSTQWRFFLNAFLAGTRGEQGGQTGVTDLYDFKSEFVLPGYVLSIGALVVWAPFLYLIIQALTEGIFPSQTKLMLFSLLPLIYWPMAMALVSTSGRMTEVFIVTGVLRGIWIGGLEYVFVAALGVGVFFVVDRLTSLAQEVAVYHWALFYVLLGYVSGMQGYLIGSLLRRRPRMIEGVVVTETEAD